MLVHKRLLSKPQLEIRTHFSPRELVSERLPFLMSLGISQGLLSQTPQLLSFHLLSPELCFGYTFFLTDLFLCHIRFANSLLV